MSDNPLTQFDVSPELLEVTNEYVKTLNIDKTATALAIPKQAVVELLEKKEAKRYIDAIFLEQGYLNRNKLNDVMTGIIDLKLEEMEETGLGSNKDILEILKFAHQMRMDHAKAQQEDTPGQQYNIQNNFGGDNYSKLMEQIITGGSNNNGSKPT